MYCIVSIILNVKKLNFPILIVENNHDIKYFWNNCALVFVNIIQLRSSVKIVYIVIKSFFSFFLDVMLCSTLTSEDRDFVWNW